MGKPSRCADCVLALENESNPHNLRGMMRSSPHFGVRRCGAGCGTAGVGCGYPYRRRRRRARSADYWRQHCRVLHDLRQAGYTVVTTSSEQGKPLFKTSLPAKMVLVLGQEYEGLPDAARDPNDLRVKIDGTGNVAG
ncbi:TrmH family RNA methyltransferase [Shigella flexneri]